MRMATVFRKELLDTIRDKRTILMMVVIPLLVVPVLISVVTKLAQRQAARAEAEVSAVAFLGREFAPELFAALEADSMVRIVSGVPRDALDSLIRSDSLDGAVAVPPDFRDLVDLDRQGSIEIFFRSSNQLNVTERRMRDAINAFDDRIVASRIERFELDPKLFDAIEILPVDISSLQEVLGKTVGGFLPYIFIIFCFSGAMYPGIDLGAGEKERGTLETVLSSPASRLDIVLGKFLVVALIGLASAVVAILGLYLGVRNVGEIPENIMTVVWDILNVRVVGMLFTLLVPLAAFFAALILAVSINAKSFKEAQSSLTPLTFIVILPVAVGLMPGIELTARTALIPILNVSLATKEVIAGTVNVAHLAMVYLSLFAVAGLSILFCVKWFNREETLFKS